MEVKDTLWFTTPAGQCIGIVKGIGQGGETRYYIGIGTGADEEMDKEYIASRGTPVYPTIIQSFFQLESKATIAQALKEERNTCTTFYNSTSEYGRGYLDCLTSLCDIFGIEKQRLENDLLIGGEIND